MTEAFSVKRILRETPLRRAYQVTKLFVEKLERDHTLRRAARDTKSPRTLLPYRLMYVYRDNAFDLHSREMGLYLLRNFRPVEVVSFGAGERVRGKQHLTTNRLLEAVDAFRPEVIFGFDRLFTPDEVQKLKARGVLLLLTSDGFNSFDSDELPQAEAIQMMKRYDAYFVAYGPHTAPLRARDIPAEEFPLWADTELFAPLGLKKDIDVLFIGTNSGHSKPYREPILRRISEAAHLTVVGPRTHFSALPRARKLGPVSSKQEINLLFNRAKLVLGFDRLIEETKASNLRPDQEFLYDVGYQVKDRTTCVLASGSCYLVEDHPENRRLFEAEKELVLWSEPEDLLKKIQLLLSDPAERERIGAAGRARILRDYSTGVRVKQVLARIEALKNPVPRKGS